ncbi:MAG: NADH-quinone oxidoreductase subunit NuoD [Armatimonadetes bacterium CG07_land_8_20_14_0_80_40_9]|nr:MAG: NADH-quinone oxidoreductase subunit NuoD [Armatimonadetes bacterium CG07_land_8_20_14_0_80_40_9]
MIKTEEFFVNMGPQHPSTHGVLRLLLELDGEVIVGCTPHIGYLHRGIEKIAEMRSYTQFIPFTDRLDYLASMNNNLAYVQAVEKLMGIDLPKRVKYIRVIMAELNRIASHLVFWGCYAQDLGAVTPFLYAFREREKIIDLFEMTCGARLTYNYLRIGGVSRDLPEGFKDKVLDFLKYFKPRLVEYDNLITNNEIFIKRTKGIGILSKEDALALGVSGPNLRASGVRWDLRRGIPYANYEEFEFDIPTGSQGDCFDRYYVRVEEMRQSVRILEQAINSLPEGEFKAKVPKVIKPPEGEVYSAAENPRGELGFYIISDGSSNPYRLKVRAPSFINLQVLPKLLVGFKVADVIAVVGSIDLVMGEVDR